SLKEEVATLCRRFEPTYWLEHDGNAEYPWEFVRAFAERGWLGLVIPPEHGGAGLGVTEAGMMLEAICESGAGLSGASPIHFYLFPLAPVIRHCSGAMKADVLPVIAWGCILASLGLNDSTAS